MNELSTSVAAKEDIELLEKAGQIFDLLRDAAKLGFSLTLPPEQLQILVRILENAELYRPEKKDANAN